MRDEWQKEQVVINRSPSNMFYSEVPFSKHTLSSKT